jgi:hypothetical protein
VSEPLEPVVSLEDPGGADDVDMSSFSEAPNVPESDNAETGSCSGIDSSGLESPLDVSPPDVSPDDDLSDEESPAADSPVVESLAAPPSSDFDAVPPEPLDPLGPDVESPLDDPTAAESPLSADSESPDDPQPAIARRRVMVTRRMTFFIEAPNGFCGYRNKRDANRRSLRNKPRISVVLRGIRMIKPTVAN